MIIGARATRSEAASLFDQIRMNAMLLAHHLPRVDPVAAMLLNRIIEKSERGVGSARPDSARSLQHHLSDITNMLTVTLGHLSLARAASPTHAVNRSEELEYACQAAELGVSTACDLAVLLRTRT
jgi:hypothetical protein